MVREQDERAVWLTNQQGQHQVADSRDRRNTVNVHTTGVNRTGEPEDFDVPRASWDRHI
jgi:hypothetical protein